jgi:hypothetical protein
MKFWPFRKQPPRALRVGDTGRYGDLSLLPNPERLVLVFVPKLLTVAEMTTFAAGRYMLESEFLRLRNDAACLVVPSRTEGHEDIASFDDLLAKWSRPNGLEDDRAELVAALADLKDMLDQVGETQWSAQIAPVVADPAPWLAEGQMRGWFEAGGLGEISLTLETAPGVIPGDEEQATAVVRSAALRIDLARARLRKHQES